MICLDTMVLIWGLQDYSERIRQVQNKTHEEIVRRAGVYLDHIRKENEKILVPTPVLSEFLTGLKPDKAKVFQALVSERYIVADYNAATASLAADLFRMRREHYGHKFTKSEMPYVKADTMIAAIAHVHGAKVIITHDTKEFQLYESLLKQRHQGRLRVSEIPEISIQAAIPGLF